MHRPRLSVLIVRFSRRLETHRRFFAGIAAGEKERSGSITSGAEHDAVFGPFSFHRPKFAMNDYRSNLLHRKARRPVPMETERAKLLADFVAGVGANTKGEEKGNARVPLGRFPQALGKYRLKEASVTL
jgi:hypothetical protein